MYEDDYQDDFYMSDAAKGFGFESQREFDEYCDKMEADAKSCEMDGF